MSIDDGVKAGADMDSANDAAVVIINATPGTQIVGNFKDGDDQTIALDGFQLSAAHSSENSIAGDASFANGEFTVPAWSAAVFVKPQGSARGTGLPVSKKQDPSTVEPFNVPVYLPGTLIGSWDFADANKFTFTGADYSYALSTEVTKDVVGDGAQSVEFKVSDKAWGDDGVNYGVCTAGAKLTAGTPLTLCPGTGTGNIALDVAKVGTYHFVFKAMNKDKPTLTLSIEEPAAACELLPDSSDTATLGTTKLALVGKFSGWNFDAQYQFSYKGNSVYQAKVTGPLDMTGDGGFKMRGEEWSTQFFANEQGNPITSMEFAKSYQLSGFANGSGDLAKAPLTLASGDYIFQVKFDSVPTSVTAPVGSMQVCQLP